MEVDHLPRQDYGIWLGDPWNGLGVDGLGYCWDHGRRRRRMVQVLSMSWSWEAGSFFTLVLDLY